MTASKRTLITCRYYERMYLHAFMYYTIRLNTFDIFTTIVKQLIFQAFFVGLREYC